ncbi:MAG TPA: hypothetical protein PKL78_00655 [Anaerolineales bacterium]|nr:hypothetical protein [Anaerolineales bacterium]
MKHWQSHKVENEAATLPLMGRCERPASMKSGAGYSSLQAAHAACSLKKCEREMFHFLKIGVR